MFSHFMLILIPYLVSCPVETMILPHVYKMPLLIIQSFGFHLCGFKSTSGWKIVKTIQKVPEDTKLEFVGVGLSVTQHLHCTCYYNSSRNDLKCTGDMHKECASTMPCYIRDLSTPYDLGMGDVLQPTVAILRDTVFGTYNNLMR